MWYADKVTARTCNSSSKSERSISGASVIKVVGLLHAISTWVVFVGSVNTRATLQSLLHRGLGTGTTGKVSVAANRRSRASGEIVVRYRGEVASGIIPPSTVASGKAHHVIVACRVEGRRVGRPPTVGRKATVVLCGLPVDRLKTILELSGGAELPLANNGPKDYTSSNGRGNYDEDHYGRVREA
jgi:hypothetical protein